MIENIGNTDRIIRICIGISIIVTGFYFNNWMGILGFGPLLTAFLSFCPLYSMLNINTFGHNNVK
jgi:hypothetical protein